MSERQAREREMREDERQARLEAIRTDRFRWWLQSVANLFRCLAGSRSRELLRDDWSDVVGPFRWMLRPYCVLVRGHRFTGYMLYPGGHQVVCGRCERVVQTEGLYARQRSWRKEELLSLPVWKRRTVKGLACGD